MQASGIRVVQFGQPGAKPQKMVCRKVYGGLHTQGTDGQKNTCSKTCEKKFFAVRDGITGPNHRIIDGLVVTSSELAHLNSSQHCYFQSRYH